jgi:hypothetical protein
MPGKVKRKTCDVVRSSAWLARCCCHKIRILGMGKIWSGSEFLGVAYPESYQN